MNAPWWAVALLALAGEGDELTDEQRAELARHFGFGPMQVYKLKQGIQSLKLADLDGDGRLDIIVWNPVQNRFELFFQPRPGEAPSQSSGAALERNELPNRGNLRNESISVSYRVATLEVAEVTGDGRPDILFFGEPKELVILPGLGDGKFGPPRPTRASEGDARAGALAVGDFNGDKRADVALLGENVLLMFYQRPEGGLGKPVRLVHNVPQTRLMLACDLNGDQRDDLIIGADDNEYGALAFLQQPGGAMGASIRVRVPRLRSITIAPRAGGGADDVFSVDARSGRVMQFRWDTPPESKGTADWPQLLYSFPFQSKSKQQPLAVGDVTRDGRPDVVAVDPDAAQMVLLAGSEGGLRPAEAFPTLVKCSDVCIGDADGDGVSEVLCASPDEKMIGVSKFEDGRLTFPTPYPIAEGAKPLAVTIGSLRAGEKPGVVAYLARHEEGNRIHLVAHDGAKRDFEAPKLDDDPTGLRFADVDRDGLNDLLLFVRFSPLITFLQKSDGSFQRLEGPHSRSELVKEAPIEGFDLADVDGDGKPELLLAQKTLARALAVKDGRWTVVDQYNPESSESEVVGLAVLPQPSGPPKLALYDRKVRDLLIFARKDKQPYAVQQTMPAGQFDLRTMLAGPLGPGGGLALLLSDPRKLAVFPADTVGQTLVETHSYESPIKDAFLTDTVIGDVNHDGIRDVIVVESRKANLEVLTTLPDGGLVRVTSFQVFQGKRFSDEPERGGDPREVLIGDVTGDRVDDIVLIAHDRVIVYPGQ